MRTTFISRVAVMFLLVFSSWFVLATFSYGSEAGEETVCLRKPNAEELAIVIRHGYEDIKEYRKMVRGTYNQELEKTIDVTVIDINNDNKPDIVFTDVCTQGSCGTSWSVLINLGNGKYREVYILDCLKQPCVTFLKEMKNGFRMARIIDVGVLFYDAKKGGYVDRKGRR